MNKNQWIENIRRNEEIDIEKSEIMMDGHFLRDLINKNGTTIERIVKLVEADQDGRCVVLPFAEGSSVYIITDSLCKWREIDRCASFCDGYGDCWEGEKIVEPAKFELSMLKRIGKTVFTTREAAEAALKGEQDESV